MAWNGDEDNDDPVIVAEVPAPEPPQRRRETTLDVRGDIVGRYSSGESSQGAVASKLGCLYPPSKGG